MTILTHALAAMAGAIITAICMAALVAGRSKDNG